MNRRAESCFAVASFVPFALFAIGCSADSYSVPPEVAVGKVPMGALNVGVGAARGDGSSSADGSTSATDSRTSRAIADAIQIPFEQFELKNGLRLIVHEDHKAPIVGVMVWYHVGSKDEKPGKTGFAHLFEHLMFQGSENLHGEFFDPLTKVGVTGINGTTNTDRTNYFEVVPTSSLDLALWLESDRMGHLLGAIDQAKLDEQRGVVQNEKRQGENRPYGLSRTILTRETAPVGHPYSWTTIGSMEDLNAATLDDVKEWFRAYYGAANATLVVAGDVKPAEVLATVEKHFGDIPSGPPIARPRANVAPISGTRRHVLEDRAGQARITFVWNVAPWGDPSIERLNLLSDVLAGGKTSRLYQRLVVKEQLATDANANIDRRELGGQFTLTVTATPRADLARIEQIVDDELTALAIAGPTEEEVERARVQELSAMLRRLERVGSFGSKSELLAEFAVFGGDPGGYKSRVRALAEATPAQLRDLTAATLRPDGVNGRFVLHAIPFPQFQTLTAGADRTKLPDGGTPAAAQFPAIRSATLKNGLTVWLAERHNLPMVELRLLLSGGSAADPAELSGLATLTMDLLDEGTKSRTALVLAEELERLGANLSTSADLDGATVSLSALASSLGPSLDLFADVILNPAFPTADFERLRSEAITRLQGAKLEANAMAARVRPLLQYGKEHPYGRLGGGNGTEPSLSALTTQAMTRFHAAWFKPNHAQLLVVGDTTLEQLVPELERRFGGWKQGDVPAVAVDRQPAPRGEKPVVYLMDRPGAVQSVIVAALLAPRTGTPADLALDAMNDAMGGGFISRINMNLREDKHWSYGARSSLANAKGPRPWVVSAPVQTDKTKESLLEVQRELADVLAGRPIDTTELERVQAQTTLALPGRWETNNAILGSLREVVQYGLPADWWSTYAARVRALSVDDVNAAARSVIDPAQVLWIVVGDRARIEEGVRAAGLGEVVVIDADGAVVGPRS